MKVISFYYIGYYYKYDTSRDWYMDFIGVQFEIEEDGGNTTLYGEFKAFSAYITKGAM